MARRATVIATTRYCSAAENGGPTLPSASAHVRLLAMPESLHEGESLGGASRSSGAGVAAPACKLRLQRTNGEVRLCVRRESSGRHRLQHLRQSGAAKALFPRNHQDGACDVVLLNTAGGLAGGDELRWQATAAAGSALRLTTQTAERV
ncbi:MAG TPA: urease accessory protein UreD, partial [Sphingomonas sp.]